MFLEPVSIVMSPVKPADPPTLPTLEETPRVCLRESLTPAEREALERLAFDYGTSAESYLIVEPDGQCLMLPELTGAAAIVQNFCTKHLHVTGGLLAPESEKPRLLQALRGLVGGRTKTVNCYSILEEEIPLFEAAGFQINKFGEEPVLELGNVTWSGKPYEWIRRQANYCERVGVFCSEIHREQLLPAEWEALKAEMFSVLREDLADRPYPHELLLLEGKLMPDLLGRRRLFVARREGHEGIEAFLICNPMRGGREWGFESYRRRKDATRGVMAYLMKTTIDQLQAEGVEQVDFCVVPGAGMRTRSHPTESWLVQRGLDLWYRRFDMFMNFQGQLHFKSRFRPRMISRYVCAYPRASISSCLSFFRTAGAFSPSYRNVARVMWNRLRQKFRGSRSGPPASDRRD
jgi:phosphatidylglycerol lysyltransferase